MIKVVSLLNSGAYINTTDRGVCCIVCTYKRYCTMYAAYFYVRVYTSTECGNSVPSLLLLLLYTCNQHNCLCIVCVVASYQLLATALYSASMNGYLQVVRLLLGRGSEVDYRTMVRQSYIISFTVDSVALSIVTIVLNPAVILRVDVCVCLLGL